MPELPEVETLRRSLLSKILDKKIASFEVLRAPGRLVRTLQNASEEEFRSALVGASFTGLTRKGKFLVAPLSTGETVVFHLMLSGWLEYFSGAARVDEAAIRYASLKLTFEDGSVLYFTDRRNMGRVFLIEDMDFESVGVLAKMGVEPLGPEFTLERFRQIVASSPGKTVKALLTDQQKVAGIGNIYSDEVMRRAGVRPDRRVASLSDAEIEALYEAIPEVLEDAIDEIDEGREGEMFSWRRKGATCPICGGEVIATKQGASHYYWCPKCQK